MKRVVSAIQRKARFGLGAVATASVGAFVLAAAFSGAAWSQKAADPSLTGASMPDEVIMARQLLMDANETAMMSIDQAGAGKDLPLEPLKQAAYTVYTAMTAFPHLFPPETKPMTSADGSPSSTAAAAAVWDDFEAFYAATQMEASAAFDASQSKDLAEFAMHAKDLRAGCDSCHAKYMHVVDPSQPPG